MAAGAYDLDTHLQLRTDERALAATLRVGPKVPLELVDEDGFRTFLESRGVIGGRIDREALKALAAEIRAHPGLEHSAVIARGVSPADGSPQKVNWTAVIAKQIDRLAVRRRALEEQNKPSKAAKAADSTSEPINFYEQSAFVFVTAGEELAVVSPPGVGEDGEDVFGKVVKAQEAAQETKIDRDTLDLTDDLKLFSKVEGNLIYEGVKLGIEKTLHVAEDVGFETGNINFPGPVEIGGGVRDRFIVRARGSVTIRKLVEASTVHSQRDIALERGAAGRETGLLDAGQNIQAGYLEGVRVSCGMNCCVRHEITNCQVRALGMVQMPTGALRGGIVIAARGIEAGVAGSVQETRTELVVGGLDELEELLRQARSRASETEVVLEAALNRQEMLNSAGNAVLTPEQNKTQLALQAEIDKARRRIGELNDAALRLEENLRQATCPVLRINQMIYAGVIVWLPGFRATFRNELKGECIVRIGPEGTPIAEYRGVTHPLSKFAKVETDDRAVGRPIVAPSDEEAQPEGEAGADADPTIKAA